MTESALQTPVRAGEAFDLCSAAAAFRDKFPALKDRVSFVDLCTGDVFNADPAKPKQLQELIAQGGPRGADAEELKGVAAQGLKDKNSYSWRDGHGNYIVFMYLAGDQPSLFGDAVPPARGLQFIFDHETGHIVVPEGSDGFTLMAENAADAYALLCDLQRHGGDTSLAEVLLVTRASFALFSGQGILNFSSPLIEKILGQSEEIAGNDLSPAEMVTRAGQLAAAHALDFAAAQRLHESLKKLKGHPDIGTLAGVVLETPLPDTFKWTSTVLKAVLDGRLTLPGQLEAEFNMAANVLPKQIAAREREFAAARPEPVAPQTPAKTPAP